MIQLLEIQNFQSHKKSLLEFDPGVNVIVGTSDSGKSAIIRALRWIVWNKPSGDSMCSNWGGNTHVSIETDSHRIARNKGSVNSYVLGDVDSEEVIEFKAFGQSVPDEITNALNLSDVNLQAQMDSPYLLSATPGEVALHFNKVAGLFKIDQAQQNVEKEIRSLTSDIKYKKAEQDRLTENLSKFDYLEMYEIELEVLEEMAERKTIYGKNIGKLITCYNSIVVLSDEIEETSAILQDEDSVNKLISDIAIRDEKIVEAKKLNRLTVEYNNRSLQIEEEQALLLLEPALIALSEKIENRKTLSLTFTRLNALIKSLNGISISLEEDNRNLGLQMAKFKKEMPDVCPLCDSVLKKK